MRACLPYMLQLLLAVTIAMASASGDHGMMPPVSLPFEPWTPAQAGSDSTSAVNRTSLGTTETPNVQAPNHRSLEPSTRQRKAGLWTASRPCDLAWPRFLGYSARRNFCARRPKPTSAV